MIEAPLTLPCGATLPNRLTKAAMTERLADQHNEPTPALERLYRAWSHGGAGLLLTGNVMVDRHHLESPGNVAIAAPPSPGLAAKLRQWAAAAREGGNAVWVQLSHAGRQTQKIVNPQPLAPSAVTVALPGGQFGTPRAMTEAEIGDVVERFTTAARAVREAGFDGVQIHAAHGYLLSSFLSPLTNQRTDQWGASLENRARLLLAIVGRVREAVGDGYPVAVKINSADFQRGGFALDDSVQVASWLDAAGIDLIEISGGSYEQPAMMNLTGIGAPARPQVAASTRAREAYFQEFAPRIRQSVRRARLMVTGGFRTRAGMEAALDEDGIDVVGLARPLCVEPDTPGRLLRGEIDALPRWEEKRLGPGWLGPRSPIGFLRTLNGFGVQSWYYEQLRHIGETGQAKPDLTVLAAFVNDQRRTRAMARALAER